MPISQARIVDWDCRHCGEVFSRLSWLAIDAKERPDLRGQLVGIAQDHCPICEQVIQRKQPLLVLRLATVAPLIVARDSQDQRDPLDTLGEVVCDVQRALSDARLTVPGPALLLSFRELEAAAGKQIVHDFEVLLAGWSGSNNGNGAFA